MRVKQRGIWRQITWAEFWRGAEHLAQALRALGVQPGDRVAIQAGNRPEWLSVEVACDVLGAVVAGLDPDGPPQRARVYFAEDQEQLDKVLAVLDDWPDLHRVVHLEPRGIRGRYAHPKLLSWDELTAGAEAVSDVDAKAGRHDLTVASLPLHDATERARVLRLVTGGVIVHFGPPQESLREVQPTILFAPPDTWERLHADVTARLAGASPVKRRNARLWLRVADRVGAGYAANGGRHSFAGRAQYTFGFLMCFRALRERVGLRRIRVAASDAAPIRPEVLRFFAGIGVPLRQDDGQGSRS